MVVFPPSAPQSQVVTLSAFASSDSLSPSPSPPATVWALQRTQEHKQSVHHALAVATSAEPPVEAIAWMRAMEHEIDKQESVVSERVHFSDYDVASIFVPEASGAEIMTGWDTAEGDGAGRLDGSRSGC